MLPLFLIVTADAAVVKAVRSQSWECFSVSSVFSYRRDDEVLTAVLINQSELIQSSRLLPVRCSDGKNLVKGGLLKSDVKISGRAESGKNKERRESTRVHTLTLLCPRVRFESRRLLRVL